MNKKLILEIQSILKSLIEDGDNNQDSLMWELNKCVDNFLRKIPTNKSLKTVLQKLGVSVDINQTPDAVTLKSDFYTFSKVKKVYRHNFGIFSLHYNTFENRFEEDVEVRYITDFNIQEFVFAVSIGYHILYYNYDNSHKNIYHKIHYNDMLLTTPQEHIINCLALMFMFPLSYVMDNLKSKREQAMYEFHELDSLIISNKFFAGCNDLTFMNFRLRDVEHLMCWLSQNRPEEFKDLKSKYQLLFIN